VLMAPLTGQVVARWILEGSPGRDMSPFTIDR
jgi:glycine/D-amino acid oxidase-like deaminating enzyme